MGVIIHGNQNFGYATINTSGATPSFSAPVMLPGMVSCEIEVDQETNTIYADNKAYCQLLGAKVRSATVSFRYISAAYAQLLGFMENQNGMLTDTGVHSNHCIFFETVQENCEDSSETRTLHYLYNVKGGEPSVSTATDEDDIEAQEIEVEYSANDSSFVVDDNGKYVQYGYLTRTAENATLYDTFTQTVLKPTD